MSFNVAVGDLLGRPREARAAGLSTVSKPDLQGLETCSVGDLHLSLCCFVELKRQVSEKTFWENVVRPSHACVDMASHQN